MLIDGTGGPPRGPVDIVVERQPDHGDPQRRHARRAAARRIAPPRADHEIDATGMYVMPGFVDAARARRRRAEERRSGVRLQAVAGARRDDGARRAADRQRAVGEREGAQRARTKSSRRASSTISGRAPAGARAAPQTPEQAREWVNWAKNNGVDGLKLGSERPEMMAALLDEAKKLGLGIDGAPGADRRRADERDQGGAARPRHRDALLRALRIAAEGLRRPAVPGRPRTTTTSRIASARSRGSGTRFIRRAARSGRRTSKST